MHLTNSLAAAFAIVVSMVAPGAAGPQPSQRTIGDSAKASVDVELVLAVDVSYSMDIHELRIQREGYAEAIVSTEFLSALKTGVHGAVAISYFEWSSSNDQKLIVPWRIIDGPESASWVAAEITKAPIRRASQTSISAAINFAMRIFEKNPYKGLRRVIDISGDGPNNQGEPVVSARNTAVAHGVTINGLPIMIKPIASTTEIHSLDAYYKDCVIGGPGAFTVEIRDRSNFKAAIRTKLVLEVARERRGSPLLPVQLHQPMTSCSIGEQRWRERLRG